MKFVHFDHTWAILGWLPLIRYTLKSTQKASKQGALKNDCPNENRLKLSVFIVGSCVQCFREQPNWISTPLDLALSFFSTNMSEEPPTCLLYPSKNDLQSPNIQISSRKIVCPTTKYELSWFHQPKTMDVPYLLPKLSHQNDQNGWVDTSTPTNTCLLLIQRGMSYQGLDQSPFVADWW